MAARTEFVRIYNNSTQMIPLQMRAPNSDFYSNEHQIRIMPGKDVSLPKSYLMSDQLENLQRRRLIKVTYTNS